MQAYQQPQSTTIYASFCVDFSFVLEGNLPASFADMQQNMEDLIIQANNDTTGDRSTQAQLILYSCFHTIKETTAVLQAVLCRGGLPGFIGDEVEWWFSLFFIGFFGFLGG